MSISLDQIKELREVSGAGMSDCKKALEETSGDIKTAIDLLRKKGIAKAAKRSSREASEGVIKVKTNEAGSEGYIVEVNSETDFVARNEQFQEFAEKVLEIIETKKPQNDEDLLNKSAGEETVQANLENLGGVIGEKIGIKSFSIIESNGTVAAYSHMNGKIGVLVALDKEGENELARDIAMQIAAANPKYLNPEEIPEEEVNKEKEIYKEQLIKEGKPENIIDKILVGKIKKYYEEVCLVEQEYIKDDKKKVKDILGDVKVEKFIRYSL